MTARKTFFAPPSLAQAALERQFPGESQTACITRLLLDLQDAIAENRAPKQPRITPQQPATHSLKTESTDLHSLLSTYWRRTDAKTLCFLLRWALQLPRYYPLTTEQIIDEVITLLENRPIGAAISIKEILAHRWLGTRKTVTSALRHGSQQGRLLLLHHQAKEHLWIDCRPVSGIQVLPSLYRKWVSIYNDLRQCSFGEDITEALQSGREIAILYKHEIRSAMSLTQDTTPSLVTWEQSREVARSRIGSAIRDRQTIAVQCVLGTLQFTPSEINSE